MKLRTLLSAGRLHACLQGASESLAQADHIATYHNHRNWQGRTRSQLVAVCRARGIRIRYNRSKRQLMRLLAEHEARAAA